MNRYCIYLLFLATPCISLSMDWSKWGSSCSSSDSLNRANPADLPIPPRPPTLPSRVVNVTSNQTNNNNQDEAKPAHIIINDLRKILFYGEMSMSSLSLTSEQVTSASQEFKDALAKNAPHLKGPDFYALQNHIFELENALGHNKCASFQHSLQEIEKTVDQYLEDSIRQEETLEYSFYLSPEHLKVPLTLYYLNFFSATHAYIEALQKQPLSKQHSLLSNTCTILNTRFEALQKESCPNVLLTGRSKLATFASLCLNKFTFTQPSSGVFDFDTTSAKETLLEWQRLMPGHIGIESAWGRRYDRSSSFYQEDRIAFYTSKTFDCCALFDGHGGNQAADYCSEHLINNIVKEDGFEQVLLSGNQESMQSCVESAFQKSNSQLAEKGINAGTTVLLAFLPYNSYHGFIVQLGDSEGHLFDNNNHYPLTPSLHNATNADEVERVKKEHGQGTIIMGRVGGVVSVTRALGNDPLVRKYLSIKPDITKFPLSHGGICLLGTDGMFENNQRADVAHTIGYYYNRTAGEIAVHAMNKVKPYNGDNKSVMIIKLDPYVSQS